MPCRLLQSTVASCIMPITYRSIREGTHKLPLAGSLRSVKWQRKSDLARHPGAVGLRLSTHFNHRDGETTPVADVEKWQDIRHGLTYGENWAAEQVRENPLITHLRQNYDFKVQLPEAARLKRKA